MKYLSQLKRKDLSGEVVLVRADFNIEPEMALYSPRVTGTIPTLRFLRKRKARIVLMSHRGRPHGERSPSLSLRSFGKIIGGKMRTPVSFLPVFDFDVIQTRIEAMHPGEILLLENLRFLPGEEKNDAKLAKKLASLGTMYVNDAFGNAHRAHASVDAITRHIPSYAGFLLEAEIKNLTAALRRPKKPLVVISGGAKVSTKIGLIRTFMKKANVFLIGGAMANTFLKSQGEDIGDSIYERSALALSRSLMNTGKIVLPVDTMHAKSQILDIGPKTQRLFAHHIAAAKTIVWNGPLGFIEDPLYAQGTKAIIRAVAKSRAYSIVGGGETVELIEKMRVSGSFDFVSTGGGAMLEFLSGKKLPAIEALNRAVSARGRSASGGKKP